MSAMRMCLHRWCCEAWLLQPPSPRKRVIRERPAGEGARQACMAEILGATALTP